MRLRSWIFGLAVLSFVALYAVSATHLHLKDADERDCPFCSLVGHQPADHAPPIVVTWLPAPVEPLVHGELHAAALAQAFSMPASRAPPRAHSNRA
jgi:hypothetical protein